MIPRPAIFRNRLRHSGQRNGFTLIELILVVGIMVLMMGLLIPAFNPLNSAGNFTKGVYDIAGVLDEARTYAMANNTYVWVGVTEEDGSRPSTTPYTSGTGRVVISVVASQDGTRYSDSGANPPAFGAGQSLNQVRLVAVAKLLKVNNVHLGTLNVGLNANIPPRPTVPAAYQVGDPSFADHSTGTAGENVPNTTTFTYPLTVAQITSNPQYTFSKIIEFDPSGEASKIDENTFSGPGPQPAMEFGLQPANGSLVSPLYTGTSADRAGAAIQIEGISGKVRIFRS
ncbi:MAG TPA: prepilin-type N-terminal cleavage/methylation domain-containing protein [Chthoniobacteraceae bacterium]|jgi:prepilin-type N-terminal cleavage/methylation domain-containing protein|nr:prepilin-type N-terminal cleavage/methylation domain-containing protein [Chthoniobacteraceae bacterium]